MPLAERLGIWYFKTELEMLAFATTSPRELANVTATLSHMRGTAAPSLAAAEAEIRRALREDALSGAAIATRYCSPRNRASELQPEVFARYLSDPWYSILAEWDEIEEEEEDDDDDDDGTTEDLEVDVTVRREGEDTFSMVSWRLSLYNGQWLIDSMNII